MLNEIYQGLDPIAFSLGPLVVRWYGLAYVLGFVWRRRHHLLRGEALEARA